MDEKFKIKLNYKKNYSFGIFNSGYDLFCYLFLENLENRSFSALKIKVSTAPNILLSGECDISYIAPQGNKAISCDFIRPNFSVVSSLKIIVDVSVNVQIISEDGIVLQSADFPLKLLPYNYFSGLHDMPETLAFFVTPEQKELEEIEPKGASSDPIDFCNQLYDNIKAKKITFSSEDYSGSVSLPVRLAEKVLRDRFATPMELCLLFASVLEKHGISPIIAFLGKGKFYCGFSFREKSMNILSVHSKGRKNLEDLYFIDASFLAYGSELAFDSALFDSKNALQLTDENIVILDISKCRKHHLLPLPNRVSDGGNFVLTENLQDDNRGEFSEYYAFLQEYHSNEKISSILTSKVLQVNGLKNSYPFLSELDVNQNKILAKIINNDFTLIRAQHGTGASTVFAHAANISLKNNKSVLYITDKNYHSGVFSDIASDLFDRSFVLDLTTEKDKVYKKADFEGIFSDHSALFDAKSKLDFLLSKMDDYYAHLEGGKKIVSSFLVATDRYNQLRDASDAIIFSPEQVGMLSDEMVQEWFSCVNDIVKVFSEIGSLSDNPLQLINRKFFSYEFKSKLIRQLEDILRSIESICALRDQIASFFPSLGGLRSFQIFFAFQDLMRLFSEFYAVPELFFEQPDRIDEHFRKVTSLIQAKNENDSIVKTIKVSFNASIFELDAVDLFERYQALSLDKSLKAITQRRSIFKIIKKYLLPNCDVENVEYILSRLNAYHRNIAFIQNEREYVFRLLSVPYLESDASWSALQFAADLCYQCYSIFQGLSIPEKLTEFVSDFKVYADAPGISDKIIELRALADEFTLLKSELGTTLGNQLDYFYSQAAGRDQDYFSIIYASLTSVLGSSDHLKSWCQWLTVRERAVTNGLKNLVSAVENGKIAFDDLKRGFLRAFFKAVCEYNFIAYPDLVPDAFSFEDVKRELFTAENDYYSCRKAETDSILSMNCLDGVSQIKVDTFTFELLLDQDPLSLKKIFPCVVSDINSAKELFSKKTGLFDYIFIESRAKIAISDLLWVFSAGKHVSFAGGFTHAHRLTHSSFDLKVSAFDYLWNVTDEKYSLSATYRGASMLAQLKSEYFTGLRFDARSYCVPAPKAEPAVELHRINGFFDTEVSVANLQEAEYVVDLLIQFVLSEEKRSIGILTSTEQQKKLVLRVLAQRLRQQENLAERFRDFRRFIISSVYDEIPLCDHIVFSATFAPNRSVHGGKLPYSFLEFGDLDPKLTILNILASAKERLTLVTSFSSDDLRFTDSALPTNTAFSLLLDLAASPCVNKTFTVTGSMDGTSFIKRIASALEERNYRTVLGVQSGRFHIDLGIMNGQGEFLMGILSDQSVLNQQSNIAAIELGNSRLFERNGWKIFRLRSAYCFDSFEDEFDRLLSFLEPNSENKSFI